MTEILPWVKWRFDRWRADEGLRMCGLPARGLWVELLAIMHGCKPYGHLSINGRAPSAKQIASMVGMTTEKEVSSLMNELETNGVFSRSDSGLIFCRRMVRDHKARETGRANGLMGGNPMLIHDSMILDNHPSYEGGLSPPDNTTLYDRERERKREEEEKSRSLRSLSGAREIFDRFFAAYPNRADPDAAFGAWQRAIRTADPEEIIAGVARYPFKTDPQYQPKAAKWLNSGGWKVAESPATRAGPRATGERATMLRGWLDRLREHHGEALNGTTVEHLDRASKAVPGHEFTRWMAGIESGDPWILERIATAKVAT